MPARLALVAALLVFVQLVPGCGTPPDTRTVQQAVEEAVAAEPPPAAMR